MKTQGEYQKIQHHHIQWKRPKQKQGKFQIWKRIITYCRQANIFRYRNDFIWSLYLR